jgi:hypothetical protein
MLAKREGGNRQSDQGESACSVRMGLSFGFILGRLLAERLLRELLVVSRQHSAQDGCRCLGG